MRWEGRTIAEILELTVAEALAVFAEEPSDEEAAHRPRSASQRRRVDAIRRPLEALGALGLGYLRLGQPATELSGGEAQRIKLASELEEATGLESRVSILGYVQRGGTPCSHDRLLATRLGTMGARMVQEGNFGIMVAAKGSGTDTVALKEVAGKVKYVPADHPWVEAAREVGTSLGD